MNLKSVIYLPFLFILCAIFSVQAEPVELKTLLHDTLNNDPQVQEAYANVQASQSNVSAAKAGHYPVISLTGTQPLAQQHKYNSNAMEEGFHPGTKATLNIYAWGGIEAGVEREKAKEDYYLNQYSLTREEMSVRISQLYLSILRYNDTLIVINKNLLRHQETADQLAVIVSHDVGRMSELTQVKARLLKVEMSQVETQRNLLLTLNKLAILTGHELQPSQFIDPFRDTQADTILAQFQNINPEQNPGYQAELANARSLKADLEVVTASRKPAINLEVNATPDNSEVFVRVSWNIFDMAGYHNQEQKEYAYKAAGERSKDTLRSIREMSSSAAINMAQSEKQSQVAESYITEQTKVISNYEKQFTIGRRTLIDLLDAYNELANIETSAVISRNDYRDATLTYLSTQAQLAAWFN